MGISSEALPHAGTHVIVSVPVLLLAPPPKRSVVWRLKCCPKSVGPLFPPKLRTRPEASSVCLGCRHRAHPGTGRSMAQVSPRRTHLPINTSPRAARPRREDGDRVRLRCFGAAGETVPSAIPSRINNRRCWGRPGRGELTGLGKEERMRGTVTFEPDEKGGKREEP